MADASGNPLTNWTGGNVCYQQGRTLVFNPVGSLPLFAQYDDASGDVVFETAGAETWTPTHTVLPAGVVPEWVVARIVPGSALRDRNSQFYKDFTEGGTVAGNVATPIDVGNIRSLNEDVLKAGFSLFGRAAAQNLPIYLPTSVLDLSGHGAAIYITSPDITALTSLGPQGEHSILCKVAGTAHFGGVISHSPFAELDYFRGSSTMLKRIRFRLIFSNGAPVNLHNANWSFSLIFQEAE